MKHTWDMHFVRPGTVDVQNDIAIFQVVARNWFPVPAPDGPWPAYNEDKVHQEHCQNQTWTSCGGPGP